MMATTTTEKPKGNETFPVSQSHSFSLVDFWLRSAMSADGAENLEGPGKP